jgi:hypothetical protein
MTPSEAKRNIEDSLSSAAREWWAGCGRIEVNEIVILAQREGIAAAVAKIEDLSKAPQPTTE